MQSIKSREELKEKTMTVQVDGQTLRVVEVWEPGDTETLSLEMQETIRRHDPFWIRGNMSPVAVGQLLARMAYDGVI